MRKWQSIVDILAEILEVPGALINRFEPPYITVYRASKSSRNPLHRGDRIMTGQKDLFLGTYCEMVIAQKARLCVPNALKDKDWQRGLGSRFGYISYLGFPLLLPNGEIFGTICIIDTRENHYSQTYETILVHFRDLVESHLALLHQQRLLESKIGKLKKMDAALSHYQKHLEELIAARTRALEAANAKLKGEIADRRQAEISQKESEERFRQLVENSLTGISIIKKGRIIYQNPEYKRLVGKMPKNVHRSHLKNIHPQDAGRVQKHYKSILSKKVRSVDMDFRFYPFGEKNERRKMRWVQCRAVRVNIGGSEAILANMMDITRTKELESLMRIEDKMSSLGRVTTGIAHEIRNPLSAINMYLNALKTNRADVRPEDPESVASIAGQIQSASNKIEAIIKRVMDFSKPTELRRVLIDINQSIRKAVDLSAVAVRKAGIRMEKNLAPEIPLCRADAHLIEEVILNLITNATQALENTDACKYIEISSTIRNSAVVTIVSDSGPGVAPEHGDSIFDPFFTTKTDGAGIGLSLAHRIVSDHGGTLSVSTSKWGGAEFIMEIPIK